MLRITAAFLLKLINISWKPLFLASKQNIFPLNSLLSVVNCYHVILG